jgi:glycosyltransferase involved in cell wall biosynthesis
MIVFCHLLNDRSGSPRVLCGAIEALADDGQPNLLYVGAQGRGLLEQAQMPKRRYWYRRSRFRIVTLVNLMVSQLQLYISLTKARDIPGDAVVYMNTLLPFGAAVWAKLNRRLLICHVHEVSISPSLLRRFLTGIAARSADLLIYVSRDHLQRLPIAGRRSVVLANAVAPALQAQGRATPFRSRRSGSFEVLMLASPRDFKGVPEFLALAQAMMDWPDVSFKLVLNAEQDEISAYLGRRPLPANVLVHARTDDPVPFYETADLVVNLSRVDLWIETFGLTLVEAMSFGIPVIAPPIGGPAEVVSDGVDGLLIDSRDLVSLATAVRRLAADPQLCATMSKAAREKAEQFSQEAFARGLKGHVQALTRRSERS